MVPFGSIHGRFQPFHNAHLAYALSALGRAHRIYVGLTRVLTESSISAEAAPHRFEELENPLTYYQRARVITSALTEAGISPSKFEIGPFPIEVPKRLKEFWPMELPCFTTNVAAWNQTKISILRDEGYQVVTLDDLKLTNVAVNSGSEIRKRFRAGDQSWHDFVPTGTARRITEAQWSL